MNLICKQSLSHCQALYQGLSLFLVIAAIAMYFLVTRVGKKSNRDEKTRAEIFFLAYLISGFLFMMAAFVWFFR